MIVQGAYVYLDDILTGKYAGEYRYNRLTRRIEKFSDEKKTWEIFKDKEFTLEQAEGILAHLGVGYVFIDDV